jgi:nucleoside-diphosphate-sugar epimerase
MRVLIVGCGYVGLPLGARLVAQGHEVFGLRRSAPEELRAAGIIPVMADITRPETLAPLPPYYDWIVNCAASGGGTSQDYEKLYLQGTRNLLAWLGVRPPQKFVYTSSTSVYAQNDGSVVAENCPVQPRAPTAQILVKTENLLLAAAAESKCPAVILRVAGIYGPGRGHSFRKFLAGEARIEGDGGRFLNMIHRDDLVRVIIAALERGATGEIYNAADDEPVTQLEFFQWLATRLKRPMPPRVATDPEAVRKRGLTNKRVNNAKLKSELGYEFLYPNFRVGYEEMCGGILGSQD